MELRHIRYFLAIADTLNFSRAAEQLRVAQPALSKQIRDLEEELGGRLFHRTTARVSLTEMGHYFRQQTAKLLLQLDIATTGAQQLAKGKAGTLRIGCDWNQAGLPIARAARRLAARDPHVAVQFAEVPCHEHIARLRDHALDVGFVPSIFLGATCDDLALRSLVRFRIKVIMPPDHPLATRTMVSLRELKNERWMALDAERVPGFRVIMAEVLQFTPKYGVTTTSAPGMIAHVIAGHGIGLLPENMTPPAAEPVVAVDTDCLPMEFFAASLKHPLTPLVESYLDLFVEELRQTTTLPRPAPLAETRPSSRSPSDKQLRPGY